MQWETKTPEIGDKRIVHRFAWWPVKTQQGKTGWLETYVARELFYRHITIWDPYGKKGRWYRKTADVLLRPRTSMRWWIVR